MTLTTDKRLIIFDADGTTTVFPFDFRVDDAAHLVVQTISPGGTITTIDPANYTVTGIGVAEGGEVTYAPGGQPLTDGRLAILREVPFVQDLSITNQDGFFPQLLEVQLDQVVMQTQQLAEEIGRSVVVPVGSDVADIQTLVGGILELAPITSEIETVAGISGDVTATAGNAADISTVAGISGNVTIVAGVAAQVSVVAGIDSDITTVAGVAAEVAALAPISSDVTTVAGIASEVTNLEAVAADITTVAGIAPDVTSVAGVAADIPTVAALPGADLTTVAGIAADVVAVAGISAAVTAVDAVSAEVVTVSGIAADVTTVAGIAADVTTVANNPPGTLDSLFDVDLTTTPPATGDGLVYDGTDWVPGPAGGGMFKGNNGTVGSRSGDIFRVNAQLLDTNTTIAATENASATGPLEIDTGVILEVADGGSLAIL